MYKAGLLLLGDGRCSSPSASWAYFTFTSRLLTLLCLASFGLVLFHRTDTYFFVAHFHPSFIVFLTLVFSCSSRASTTGGRRSPKLYKNDPARPPGRPAGVRGL